MFIRIGKCNLSPIDWNMILSNYGPVWYMCLKTEIYYLKIFVKYVWIKKYVEIRIMLFKN